MQILNDARWEEMGRKGNKCRQMQQMAKIPQRKVSRYWYQQLNPVNTHLGCQNVNIVFKDSVSLLIRPSPQIIFSFFSTAW